MVRWIIGAVILLFAGLVYGFLTAEPRMMDMQTNIEADLAKAGYSWASVEMSGNEARVSGTAPNATAQQAAIDVAKAAYCSACKDKYQWHTVDDATELMQASPLPIQSPYRFSVRKTADGSVSLKGFAPSEGARAEILSDAVYIFGGDSVSDVDLSLASGAPDNQWNDVIRVYMGKLAQLDSGRLLIEDFEGLLQGQSISLDTQQLLYSLMQDGTPDPYNFVGNVAVPQAPIMTIGQSGSQEICQNLLNDLRGNRKIRFERSESTIRGDDNFDLLGELANAAKQCPKFRIAINGYTSSEGDPTINQKLSDDRANAVLFFLNEQGDIDLSRLEATGLGSQNPIASNETAEGREQNRRIEFILSRAE
jgi:OOP family OmpA-OmpF porin